MPNILLIYVSYFEHFVTRVSLANGNAIIVQREDLAAAESTTPFSLLHLLMIGVLKLV